jgi:hypothetical protein
MINIMFLTYFRKMLPLQKKTPNFILINLINPGTFRTNLNYAGVFLIKSDKYRIPLQIK